MRTSITLRSQGDDRPVEATLTTGHLRPSIVSLAPNRARLALVGVLALLLAGDDVRIDLDLGEGVHLDLVEVAGTVAYNGEGRLSAWHVTANLAASASLTWHGQPFVVSDGANVERTLRFDLHETARLRLRDTVVLGRTGELGGVIDNTTRIVVGGIPQLVETQVLRSRAERYPAAGQETAGRSVRYPHPPREAAGLLGGYRVIDSYVCIPARDWPPLEVADGVGHDFELPGGGRLWRHLGTSAVHSPIQALLRA
ncbi:urease accessory protein UreD [Micrococcales bacterium 31B]|nr:urease accessory protein UreD [Micrococcales bacterium 31B]